MEDASTSPVELDSLSPLRQHVSLHDSHASSLELAQSSGQAADSRGEPKVSFHPKSLQQPPTTAQARKLHNMPHIPYPWYVVCQESKITASQPKQQRTSSTPSIIQLVKTYIHYPPDQKPSLILLWVESLTGLAGNLLTNEKGPTAQQIDAVVTFIHSHGFAYTTLQCDGEPALVKLVKEIGTQTNVPSITSSVPCQQLDGLKRSLCSQLRALMLDFSQQYKLQPTQQPSAVSSSLHWIWHNHLYHKLARMSCQT